MHQRHWRESFNGSRCSHTSFIGLRRWPHNFSIILTTSGGGSCNQWNAQSNLIKSNTDQTQPLENYANVHKLLSISIMILTQGSVLPTTSGIARSIPQDCDSCRPVDHLCVPKHDRNLTSLYQSRPTQLTQSLHYIQSRQLPALQHFTWLTQLTQLTHLIQTSQCDSANFFDKPRNCGLVTLFCSTRRCHTWCPCSGGTLVMNQLKAIIGNNQSRTSCNAGKLLLQLCPRNRQNVLEDVNRLLFLHQIPE